MIQICFGLCLHVFLICFKYKFVIWLIVLSLIECYMIFNGWLMTGFLWLNTCLWCIKNLFYSLIIIWKMGYIYIYIYIERERERAMFSHYGVLVQF